MSEMRLIIVWVLFEFASKYLDRLLFVRFSFDHVDSHHENKLKRDCQSDNFQNFLVRI